MANWLRKRGDTREVAEKSAFDAVYASLYGTEMGSGRKQKGLSVPACRDKLSWSHRDAVHITKGHLLRYPCSRTCGVHTLYQTREEFLQGGSSSCHLQRCIA